MSLAPVVSNSQLHDMNVLILPDIHALIPYPARRHPHTDAVATASDDWLVSLAKYTPAQERNLRAVNSGLLIGRGFADSGPEQLRVISDYVHFLFHVDDWSDEQDGENTQNAATIIMNTLRHPTTYSSDTIIGKLAKDMWERMLTTIGSACRERFIQYMDTYLQEVRREADERTLKVTPKLEEYIIARRETSACKPIFSMLEYGCNIDIPHEVMGNPVIQGLQDAANDCVSWQNDIFSFNVEQSKGHTHNLVVVLKESFQADNQTALELAAALVKSAVTRFEAGRTKLPSWGRDVDDMVGKYVQGLQDWIIGNATWSFETHRYFGKAGSEVKKHLRLPVLQAGAEI